MEIFKLSATGIATILLAILLFRKAPSSWRKGLAAFLVVSFVGIVVTQIYLKVYRPDLYEKFLVIMGAS